MPGKPVPLISGECYHIFSRGNNRERIFVEERNYRHFLRLYARHIEPIAETFAYCLLPNHFHFLVRIRTLSGEEAVKDLKKPSQHMSNLCNAYAKAFNRAYDRAGALFQRPFGRVHVASDAHFARVAVYIHQNPQAHGIVGDYRDWPNSSYGAILSTQPTRLRRDEVLAWFGGAPGYAAAHREVLHQEQVAPLVPEDFD